MPLEVDLAESGVGFRLLKVYTLGSEDFLAGLAAGVEERPRAERGRKLIGWAARNRLGPARVFRGWRDASRNGLRLPGLRPSERGRDSTRPRRIWAVRRAPAGSTWPLRRSRRVSGR